MTKKQEDMIRPKLEFTTVKRSDPRKGCELGSRNATLSDRGQGMNWGLLRGPCSVWLILIPNCAADLHEEQSPLGLMVKAQDFYPMERFSKMRTF